MAIFGRPDTTTNIDYSKFKKDLKKRLSYNTSLSPWTNITDTTIYDNNRFYTTYPNITTTTTTGIQKNLDYRVDNTFSVNQSLVFNNVRFDGEDSCPDCSAEFSIGVQLNFKFCEKHHWLYLLLKK